MVAEVLAGTLHAQQRSEMRHAWASSNFWAVNLLPRSVAVVVVSADGESLSSRWIPELVDALDTAIDEYDAEIEKLILGNATLAGRYMILTSIPGIGLITAVALICWMSELGSIGNRQAAALVGVAPFANESGTKSGARHIRGGRRRPRDVLYMAALSAK